MRFAILLSVVLLSACSILPRPHDGAMFDSLVSTKVAVDKLNCDNKNWNDAQEKIHHLRVYAELRKDPQATSIVQLEQAIEKANFSNNKVFCESLLNINKVRIDTVVDAWRGR